MTSELSAFERSTQARWRQWVRVERPLSALIALRVCFFGLLSYDLWWIGLSHAPRYGAGGFNVAHLPLLTSFSPSPELAGGLYIAGGLLSLLAALGLGGRLTVGLLALLYNGVYLWSQADSYQHHYLIGLLLALFTWAPLTPRELERVNSDPDQGALNLRAHPGLDLLFIQMALIYFWTAVAKTEPVWLSGEVMSDILRNPDVRQSVTGLGASFGWSEQATFKVIAWGVMLGEYLAPVFFLLRPLRPLGFLMIPWFHISVEWVGFDIELFSYYMIALNLCLLSPAQLWRPLEGLAHQVRSQKITRALPLWLAPLMWCGASLAWAWSIHSFPVAGALSAALFSVALSTLCLLVAFKTHRLTSLSFAVFYPLLITSCVALSGYQMQQSGFGFDYYRMWGGDLSRRGDYPRAVEIYRRANRYQETLPARHAALGSALLKLKRFDEASVAYEEDVLRWAKQAERERAQGQVSGRVIRGLKRAYDGWAQSYELAGQAQNATLIRQQLQLELSTLQAP